MPLSRTSASTVDDAIGRALVDHDFREVGALARGSDLAGRDRSGISRLAHLGHLLLTLDLEDVGRTASGRLDLDAALLAVSLPRVPSAEPVGLLASLLPTGALLLDVIQVRYEQREVSQLLAAVHLLNEVLPLLAWEDVLGHAGDPTQLLRQVSSAGSLWGRPACPSTGPARRAAGRLERAVRSPIAWAEFLERSWSLMGGQLSDCAACRASCSMAARAGDHRAALQRRLSISRVFSRGPLLGARHGSAVGHAFAVPDVDEVLQAWCATRGQLVGLVPDVMQDDGRALPGLRAMVEAIAGRALPPHSVLHQVTAALDSKLSGLGLVHPAPVTTVRQP
jgi:hypothetical protein